MADLDFAAYSGVIHALPNDFLPCLTTDAWSSVFVVNILLAGEQRPKLISDGSVAQPVRLVCLKILVASHLFDLNRGSPRE